MGVTQITDGTLSSYATTEFTARFGFALAWRKRKTRSPAARLLRILGFKFPTKRLW